MPPSPEPAASSPDPSPAGVRRWVLRPGAPVLARSPGVLQVGLGEPAARIADTPAVRAALTRLGRPGGARLPAPGADPGLDEALGALRLAGLVLPTEARPGAGDDAARAQFGAAADVRLSERGQLRVEVTASDGLREVIDPLLDEAGLRLGPESGGPPVRVRRAERHVVHLVVSDGPVDRELLDPLVRSSLPHLVIAGSAASLRLGPLVEPGITACLRCVDAHESLHDPRHTLLLVQAAAQSAERPPPRDLLLDRLVLAWAVRDLCRWAEGDRPSTWSTTVDVDPVGGPSVVTWGRHPDCGCAWDDFLDLP